jgi:DNA-binding MarR family transcriptional regulator
VPTHFRPPREDAVFEALPSGVAFPREIYARAFLGLLRAGEELERKLDGDLRRAHGIGLRGYEILLHLAAFAPDRTLPMTTLTRQAPLSQSRVSRLVSELQARGLVRRSGDERDSRAVRVSLTDEGMRVLRQAQETHHRGLVERLFSRLSHDELVQLAGLTSRLLANDGG